MADDTAKPDLPHEVIGDRSDPPRAARFTWLRGLRLYRIPILMLVLAAGGFIGLYFQPPGLQKFFAATGLEPGGGTSSPIALPPDVTLPEDVIATLVQSDVIGLARLIPQGDISTVAPPFGADTARVAEVLVTEGQTVTVGDRLAVLDNLAQLQSAALLAEATVAVREASLAQTRQSVANSRDEARASLEQAEVAAVAAEQELERSRALFDRGVTTQALLDQAVSAASQAERAVDRAQATLARYLSTEPDAQPDVIVAARNLDAARIDLDRARADLTKAYVQAPISGTILEIDTRPGEKPGQAGLMRMGDVSQMMAEVEVYQDRAGEVAPGQPVDILADALGRTLLGTVEQVGLLVGRQSVVSDDTAANTDARVIKVLVRLDATSSDVASRFTNLEVVARIDTRERP